MTDTATIRETIERCATCGQQSALVAAATLPTVKGKPAIIGIAAYCGGHRHVADEHRPSREALAAQATATPRVPLYRTLADRWPDPIPLQR